MNQHSTPSTCLKQDIIEGFSVTLPKAYYLGKYEVTQAEWKKVMGTNPSVFQGDKVTDDPDRHPVDSVSWNDAQAFVKKLNELEKTTAYRLPTEAEWEYAARAGAEEAPDHRHRNGRGRGRFGFFAPAPRRDRSRRRSPSSSGRCDPD